MRAFDYHRAISIDDALSAISNFGEGARFLAGGQSLLNMMKWRLASPTALVDLKSVNELRRVERQGGSIKIGALTSYSAIGQDPALSDFPIFKDAIDAIADMQVRQLGSLGGSCCQADPHGDMPNVMCALEAKMEIASKNSMRRVNAFEFFQGPFETTVADNELLTSIHVRAPKPSSGSAYEKFNWRKGDYAIASAATHVILDKSGRIKHCSIVLGGLGLGPASAKRASEKTIDQPAGALIAARAAVIAAEDANPEADPIFGGPEYKKALIETVTRRALERAFARAIANSKQEKIA